MEDKNQLKSNLRKSYKAYLRLLNTSRKTGVLNGLNGEKRYFLNQYAKLMVCGMSEEEKQEFETMAKDVLQ